MAAEGTLTLKVLVEKIKNQVVFAESDEDFVDVLFSFLTLPMGTIVRLVRKLSPVEETGCMNNIYQSVENCDVKALRTEACKNMLLWPRNAAEVQCDKLKLILDDREPTKYYWCQSYECQSRLSHYKNTQCKCGNSLELHLVNKEIAKNEEGGIFVKESARFMFSDDLLVTPMSSLTSLLLLQKLGIEDRSTLEERTLNVGIDEVLHLLKFSLLSRAPLTDLVFPERPPHGFGCVKLEPRTTNHSRNETGTATEREKISVQLMISISRQTALYAEVGEDFVDLLFSFLTFPLGCVVELLGGSCSIRCMDNLYQSIQDLDVDLYMKSAERKAMLVSPKLAPDFSYANQPLHLQQINHPVYYRVRSNFTHSLTTDPDALQRYGTACASVVYVVDPKSDGKTTRKGGFVKGPARFMVTDDLVVTPISPISGISLLNRLKVPIKDVEVRSLSLGEDEVLTLLKASLISKNALTALFTSKKPKEEECESASTHVSDQKKPKQEPIFY